MLLKSFNELKEKLYPEEVKKEPDTKMLHWEVKVENDDSGKKFKFECYEETHSIEVGDYFLFFFGGVACVGYCADESKKYEINENDRIKDWKTIDLVTNFWRNCYKIKSTEYDLENVFK